MQNLLAIIFLLLLAPLAFADEPRTVIDFTPPPPNKLVVDFPELLRIPHNAEGVVVATLSVNNIQVQADWDVDPPFTAEGGTLRFDGGSGHYIANVLVKDKFSALNGDYQDLVATARINVNVPPYIYVMGGSFSASGRLSDIWSSGENNTWLRDADSTGWGAISGMEVVVLNSTMYLMGGAGGGDYQDDVWSSVDGSTWVRETDNAGWSGRAYFAAVLHQGTIYIMGGTNGSDYYPDVWSSVNGKDWQRKEDDLWGEGRAYHAAVSHNGTIYVLGGSQHISSTNLYRSDVWSSTDGTNWSRVTVTAAWTARNRHSAVSYGDKIYIMGGTIPNYSFGAALTNDVWSSEDGVVWEQVKANNNNYWSKRRSHRSVVFANKMYVLGGYRASGLNDVWSSEDGSSWTPLGNADWPARYLFGAVVFP